MTELAAKQAIEEVKAQSLAAKVRWEFPLQNDSAIPREAFGSASCSLPNVPKTLNAENE